eukprot:3571107-Pyramimonas_sp.AAC.1
MRRDPVAPRGLHRGPVPTGYDSGRRVTGRVAPNRTGRRLADGVRVRRYPVGRRYHYQVGNKGAKRRGRGVCGAAGGHAAPVGGFSAEARQPAVLPAREGGHRQVRVCEGVQPRAGGAGAEEPAAAHAGGGGEAASQLHHPRGPRQHHPGEGHLGH